MVMPCFLRRLIETFVTPIIIGIPIGILYVFHRLPSSRILLILIMGAFLAVTILAECYMLRSYYFFVKNRFDYFTVNLAAYGIFLFVNLVLYKFCSAELVSWDIYTSIYFLFRFFEVFSIPTIYSTLLMHLVMITVVFVAPFELYHVMDVMRTISQKENE